ncbi:hypothetical protein N431DRAFT_487576 [Stipitochalara longipes BDJ]|nr:hypothetical protein N431DRAFT_487576 [Stipitochalara longipes BDJ]
MGTSSSKAAAKASQVSAASTARKYPKRSLPFSSPRTNAQPASPSPIRPSAHPAPQESRDHAINSDAQDPPLTAPADPSLLARLQTLGPVTPNPTFSNSSTYNFASQPPLRNPDNPKPQQSSSPQSQQSSHDPSLSGQFVPSASNPQQSIFPQGNGRGEGGGMGRINPAVSLLTARYRLAEEAEREFANIGKAGGEGRQFLDVVTIRKLLEMREAGVEGGEIERRLELRKGVVGRLGMRGVVGVAG